MNKFQDEFSRNSYDDLLNEYAGDSITSKPIKPTANPEETRRVAPTRQAEDSGRDISSFSDNISSTSKQDKGQSFDIDLLNAYVEPPRKRPVKQDTTSQQNKGKFIVNIDSAKTFAIGVANKVRTVAENVRENANAAAEQARLHDAESTENETSKKKFDFNDFVGHTINSIQENNSLYFVVVFLYHSSLQALLSAV